MSTADDPVQQCLSDMTFEEAKASVEASQSTACFAPSVDSPRRKTVSGLHDQLTESERREQEAVSRAVVLGNEVEGLRREVVRAGQAQRAAEEKEKTLLASLMRGLLIDEAAQRNVLFFCAAEGLAQLTDLSSALALVLAPPMPLGVSNEGGQGELAEAHEEIMALRRQLGRARQSRDSFDALAVAFKPISFHDEYNKEAARRAAAQKQNAEAEHTILSLEEEIEVLKTQNRSLSRQIQGAAAVQTEPTGNGTPVKIIGGYALKKDVAHQTAATATGASLSQPRPMGPSSAKPHIEYLFGMHNGGGLRAKVEEFDKYAASPAYAAATVSAVQREDSLKTKARSTPRVRRTKPSEETPKRVQRRTASPKTPRVGGLSAPAVPRRSASASGHGVAQSPSGHGRASPRKQTRPASPAREKRSAQSLAFSNSVKVPPATTTVPRRRPEPLTPKDRQERQAQLAANGSVARQANTPTNSPVIVSLTPLQANHKVPPAVKSQAV